MKLDDWRLWIGATEEPFGGFVRDWLFSQMMSGRRHVRTQDVREYAIKAWSLHSPKRPLSEHGVVRAARDLVHTAAQLGLLSGDGPVKTLSAIPTSKTATTDWSDRPPEVAVQETDLLAAAAIRFANEATIFLRPGSLISAMALLG